ncbi:MAG: porin family protein [Phreatobacter sp.]|uniref:outer membrane protein n=1 Tax=Phreatobacter sp. TaxID=1966341 RepID=UPI001A4F1C0B|nr:outer membrane beta-barrel protein [Phreatobacter sp.]MBL8567835.1 porin family protein [Phreatobacter sp.]
MLKKFVLSCATVAALSAAPDTTRAADVAAPLAVPAMGFTWDGWYVGATVGWQRNNSIYGDRLATNNAFWFGRNNWRAGSSGFTAALQAGRNWQYGRVVLGLEAELGWLGAQNTTAYLPQTATTFGRAQSAFYASFRPRAGITFGNALVYGTAGIIFADFRSSIFTGPGAPVALLAPSTSKIQFGVIMGGGVEYAFNQNWSIKGEYLYYHFEPKRVGSTFTGGGGIIQFFDTQQFGHILRVGVNYRFATGGGAVIARY